MATAPPFLLWRVKFRNTIYPPSTAAFTSSEGCSLSTNSNGTQSVFIAESSRRTVYNVRCLLEKTHSKAFSRAIGAQETRTQAVIISVSRAIGAQDTRTQTVIISVSRAIGAQDTRTQAVIISVSRAIGAQDTRTQTVIISVSRAIGAQDRRT
jgi:hypothetical protein